MEKLRTVLTDSSLFRRCYIYCLFFCNISFIQVLAYASLIPLALWGVFLLFYNEKNRKVVSKTRMGVWLFAFIIFSSVTAVIHIRSNFFYNLIVQLHVSICFFVFYAMHTERHLNFRKELYYVSRFVMYATTIVGVLGLACLMAGISFEVMSIKFIIYENRFTGLYSNPNISGFVSVVACVCVHLLTKSNLLDISMMPRISRIWLFSCVAVASITLFLSDSNGAIILFIGYVGMYLMYKMFSADHGYNKKQIAIRLISLVFVGVFVVVSAFFVRYFCQVGFTGILETADVVTSSGEEEHVFSATERITFGHLNANLDSGRFKLWRQAASLFSDFPLFGIGKGNVYDYGANKFDNGIHFADIYGNAWSWFATDFHNGYATILVCSGVFGFVLFSIFGLRFAKHIFMHSFKDKNLSNSTLPCLVSFLSAYLVYAFFEKALIYDISFTVMFFWLVMGYTSCFLCMYEPDHNDNISIFKRRIKKKLF